MFLVDGSAVHFVYNDIMCHSKTKQPPTTQEALAKFGFFPDRSLPFHINSPATLLYSPAPTNLNENPPKAGSLLASKTMVY